DLFGYRAWALSGLARARAQAGEEGPAAAALDAARRAHPVIRSFDMSLYLAQIDLDVLAGRQPAAADTARQAVDWARGAEDVDEALALDAWLRISPSPPLADRLVERLAELAAMTDSALVDVLADHARALVSSDPPALLDAAERFAGL